MGNGLLGWILAICLLVGGVIVGYLYALEKIVSMDEKSKNSPPRD
ncbi:MAG: hypothetical protein Q7R62_00660 [bacterium]|nr:hypothetical protein [bacterium]